MKNQNFLFIVKEPSNEKTYKINKLQLKIKNLNLNLNLKIKN